MVRFISLQGLVCRWFDAIEVHDRKVTELLGKTIPASCPFERDIKLFDRTLFHLPFLCKLNLLYEPAIALRLKALSYLANESGEDVARYFSQQKGILSIALTITSLGSRRQTNEPQHPF